MNKNVRPGKPLFVLQVALLLAIAASAQEKIPKWKEFQSPHFLVVTDGSERQGRQLAYHFEAIRSVFEQTLGLRVESGRPFVVMGFKDEKSMRALMPEFWEKKGGVRPVGGFRPGGDKIYAFIRLDVGGEGPYRVVYHEYTHMVLHLSFRSLPLWLDEGLAEFYGASTIGDKDVRLGRPKADSIMALREGKRIPLDELFLATHDSPYYSEASKARMFYAQSWALTHYLMLAEDTGAGQPSRISRFLSLLGRGVPEDEAIRQVFDDAADLQAALGSYMKSESFPVVLIKTKLAALPMDYGARILSPAEAAARLGDFLLREGRPKDARPLLEEALRLQPDLAPAQESLGCLFLRQGEGAEALRWFEKAIAGDAASFLAYYYHAMMILTERGEADGGAAAESSLAKALQLNPSFPPACVDLARLYLRDDRNLDRALELVRRAVDIEPGSFSYRLMLGSVLALSGRTDEAVALAKVLERSARSQEDKDLARSLLEGLGQTQEKEASGRQPEPVNEAGITDEKDVPVRAGPRPVSYSWTILTRSVPGSKSLLPEGSGDALYASRTFDEVWTATIKSLTKDHRILSSDKDSGHIIAEPAAVSTADTVPASLDILIERRGPDVGVNVNVGAEKEIPLAKKTSFYNSLFEKIAVALVGRG